MCVRLYVCDCVCEKGEGDRCFRQSGVVRLGRNGLFYFNDDFALVCVGFSSVFSPIVCNFGGFKSVTCMLSINIIK